MPCLYLLYILTQHRTKLAVGMPELSIYKAIILLTDIKDRLQGGLKTNKKCKTPFFPFVNHGKPRKLHISTSGPILIIPKPGIFGGNWDQSLSKNDGLYSTFIISFGFRL